MEKYYYQERELKRITTKILSVENTEKGIGVYLEKTIIFPGGGGQVNDLGYLKKKCKDGSYVTFNIIDVKETSKGILHILNHSYEDLIDGCDVELILDWYRREDAMSQHTGQHLLSGCFYTLFKRNTKALHIGEEISQLDIEGSFTDEMVKQVEDYANELIGEKIPIKNYEIEYDKKEEVYSRRPLPQDENHIRLVEIENVDVNACCGVHWTNTSNIRFIKIKKHYKNKDGTRFEYLAGNRALEFIKKRDRKLSEILLKLNSNEDSVMNAIENIEKSKDANYLLYKNYLQKYLDYVEIELLRDCEVNTDNIMVIKKVFRNEQKGFLNEISKRLTDKNDCILVLANVRDDCVEIQLQTSKELSDRHSYIQLGKSFKEQIEFLEAKGGGSSFSAKGICSDEKGIDNFIDSIYDIYIKK